MGQTKFTVGLIGAVAEISDAHLDAINVHPDFILKGVCDINEQKLSHKFLSRKDVYLTTDYKVLLKDDEINVIIICTPNHLHATMAIDALNAHKHVLCEKPMIITPAQGNAVLKAMEKSLGVFVVSYHFEFFPEVQFLKETLHKFRDINCFRFRSSEFFYPTPVKAWNYTKHIGGVWLDWAPNALSVLRKVIAKNDCFNTFKILDTKLKSSFNLEIETNVYLKIQLDHIEGELLLDWEANAGEFIAQTTFWDSNGTEILLDHAENCIYINKDKIWCGKDLRYRSVYEDFAQRIDTKKSNIASGLFTGKLIDMVFSLSS